jgi:hypothetical protein
MPVWASRAALDALTSRRGCGIAVQLDGKGSAPARIRNPETGWRWFATIFCVFRTSALEHQSPGTILIFTIGQKTLHIFGGNWPEVEPEKPIDGFVLKWFYFICDGIPKMKHLVNSMVGNTAK